MEEPNAASAQLQNELDASVRSTLREHRRPVLHHLNADSTWLLQLPRPSSASAARRRRSKNSNPNHVSRYYYNILIDPWLAGGQSDVASWFSQQFHASPSAVATVSEIEILLRESEVLSRHEEYSNGTATAAGQDENADSDTNEPTSFIDAVAISHEFTDHCHKETLLEIHRDVPVFAILEAANLIKSWKHFRTVVVVPPFSASAEDESDWRTKSISPLPDWLSISRLVQPEDVLNYHAALIIAFNLGEEEESDSDRHALPTHHHHQSPKSKRHTKRTSHTRNNNDHPSQTTTHLLDPEHAEAVVYAPHGVFSGDLSTIARATPAVHTLALLHGLHAVRVGTLTRTALQSNLGAHNGLAAQRALQARYWMGTHDEVKHGGGLVGWFLQRKIISVQEALEEEEEERRKRSEGKGELKIDAETWSAFDDSNWVDMGNGESRVLV